MSRLLIQAAMVLLLVSCASVEESVYDTVPDSEGSISVWQDDTEARSPAIQNLLTTADRYIRSGSLQDAEIVLTRAVRIEHRAASAWSRLAWISAENGEYEQSRQFIDRSNSNTDSPDLLRFNWALYLEVSRLMNDAAGIERARHRLEPN